MRFAVYLPDCMHVAAITQPWEHALTGRDIALAAQTAERLGYSMVFLPEHYLTPTSHLELSGNHYFDATTAQAFLAGATSTITIGSMVTILPLHSPVIAAKSIATLDWLSGGRGQVTVGVGWLKEEYDAIGVPFSKRGRIADESLAAMFELWHSDTPQFRRRVCEVRQHRLRPQADSQTASRHLDGRRRRRRAAPRRALR